MRLTELNKRVKEILVNYGIILAITILLSLIIIGIFFFPDKSWEFCSVSIAFISIFITIVILYMNNKSQEDNTQKQINSFEQNAIKQMETFKRATENQISTFSVEISKVVQALNNVAEMQKNTSQEQIQNLKIEKKNQIKSFSTEIDKIIAGLKEVTRTQNKTAEEQKESFKNEINAVVESLSSVCNTQRESSENIVNNFRIEMEKSIEIMAKVCKFQILLLEATEKELTKIEKVNDSLHKVKVITEKSGENITKEIKNNRTLTTTIVNKGKEIVNEISDEVTSGRLQKSFKELGTDIKEFGKKAKDKISDFFSF